MNVHRLSSVGRAPGRTRIVVEELGTSHAAPGERMRALRRARGLTQDELARATGVSRSAVAQWETGRAGFGNRIGRVADVLGVAVRDLKINGEERARRAAATKVSRDEAALLHHFRELCAADRGCVLMLARRLAASDEG